jgi:hypothetical protein
MPPRILGQHVGEIHDTAGHAERLHGASSSTANGALAARSLQVIYRHHQHPRKAARGAPSKRSFKEF